MITIRRFAVEDQHEVQELIDQIMHEEFREDTAAFPSDDLKHILETYGGLGEAFFVALNGTHKIIGTIAIKKEDDRVALMRRLFVSKAHRKQQIGIKLIERALQFCDEVGYEEIIFKTTSRMKGANQICQKKGFKERARLQLGAIDLYKYALSLRNGYKKAVS